MKLLGTEVVNENVEGEDVLEGVEGVMLGQERRHGGVVQG